MSAVLLAVVVAVLVLPRLAKHWSGRRALA
jgi:hypothetical protein